MVSFHLLDTDGHIRIEFGQIDSGLTLSMKFKPNEKPYLLLSHERSYEWKDYMLFDEMTIIRSLCDYWGDIPLNCRQLICHWICIQLDTFVNYQIHQGDTSLGICELEKLLKEFVPSEVADKIKACMKKLI